MSKLITEALELAQLLRPAWGDMHQRLVASGTPLNDGLAGTVDPLGVAVNGEYVTVNDYVNPVSRIPALVRDLVAANEGYFIEEVFNTPGLTVEGGAILYSENFPQDNLLAAHGRPAPRSPGAEAPVLAVGRRAVKVSRPESWSGTIEVHDEVRRWNRVLDVQSQFRAAANTFAEILQARGEEVLDAFVTSSARFITDPPGSDWAIADPVENTSSTDARPSAEFARVARTFVEDKAGLRPNLLIASPEDAEHLDRVYGDRLDALLNRHNLTLRVSPRRDAGKRLYVRSGQVGTIAFDKPLGDPEYTREGKRFTDSYTLEVAPVYVANGADALLEVRES